jgi:Fic family protein
MSIETKIAKYNDKVQIGIIDYDRFNQYAITHHSTAIEGSTLTLTETELLLSEDITCNKPFHDHLMVKDHFNALRFIMETSTRKNTISKEFIQQVNAMVMKNTGSLVKTILGDYDTSLGDFRKTSVVAGNHIFVDAKKINQLLDSAIEEVNNSLKIAKTLVEKYNISFDFHFNLVSIHPFGDGNGRTSRLLMNYIQKCFDLPLSIIYKEDKLAYIQALDETRKQENIEIFRTFMFGQLDKFLSQELLKFDSEKKKIRKMGQLSYIF